MGLAGNGNFVPGKYMKYIVIAFILGVLSNAVMGWMLQLVSEVRERQHELDTEIAVLQERISFLTINLEDGNRNQNATTGSH